MFVLYGQASVSKRKKKKLFNSNFSEESLTVIPVRNLTGGSSAYSVVILSAQLNKKLLSFLKIQHMVAGEMPL